MRIGSAMNLVELARLMSPLATTDNALRMRRALFDSSYTTTEEIPEDIWDEMVDNANHSKEPEDGPQ